MNMTQKLIATTTLGEHISVGEWSGHQTNAKPGNYNVYKVWAEDDYDYSILFVHESETQNVNKLLAQLDVVDICGVDFASYGIVTHEIGAKWSLENWQDKFWQTSNKHADGYVTKTNCGDGAFLLYTNENHSVFMLDDEDVYLNTLTNEQGITDFGWLSSFSIENDSVNVVYYPKGCGIEYEREQISVEPGERHIDAIVRLMVQICNKNGYTPFPRARN